VSRANDEYVRAQDTARRLVATYLDESLDNDAAIREVVYSEPRERLGVLVGVLVSAVADTFDDLEDFSASILPKLADAYCDRGHLMQERDGERVHYFAEDEAEHDAIPRPEHE
jgi:hypothetical protein